MNETWSALVDCWGEENARTACRLQIYITDKDEAANEQLRREMESTAVDQSGAIHFGRPNLEKIIEKYNLNLIATRRGSCSVFAFCGSPELSLSLHRHKISKDMLTAITGNKRHRMEYVSESYGGVKKSKPRQPPPPKYEGNGLVTKQSSFGLGETALDEEDSTEATVFDDEDLMDAV
jgi:hypothetical protein